MRDTPITGQKQEWLNHIRAADTFDGSIADYARSEGLKPKELDSWKEILARRGLLGDPPAENSVGFVRVIAPSRPLGVRLMLPNVVRLEWHGDMRPDQLEAMGLRG